MLRHHVPSVTQARSHTHDSNFPSPTRYATKKREDKPGSRGGGRVWSRGGGRVWSRGGGRVWSRGGAGCGPGRGGRVWSRGGGRVWSRGGGRVWSRGGGRVWSRGGGRVWSRSSDTLQPWEVTIPFSMGHCTPDTQGPVFQEPWAPGSLTLELCGPWIPGPLFSLDLIPLSLWASVPSESCNPRPLSPCLLSPGPL